jgi:uncharacterized membrane protein YtjA (UPF0391 family)
VQALDAATQMAAIWMWHGECNDYNDTLQGTASGGSPWSKTRCSIIGRLIMLHYAVVFFVIALIAAVFGFTGIAAGAAEIAKVLFFLFLIIAVVTFVISLMRRA